MNPIESIQARAHVASSRIVVYTISRWDRAQYLMSYSTVQYGTIYIWCTARYGTVPYGTLIIIRYLYVRQAEDRKFDADKSSVEPVASIHGGPHVLVPFVLEDGGRLGAHAQALLRSFATLAIEKERRPPCAYRDSSSSAPTLASMWV